jgi:hypothetical protein
MAASLPLLFLLLIVKSVDGFLLLPGQETLLGLPRIFFWRFPYTELARRDLIENFVAFFRATIGVFHVFFLIHLVV